MGMYALCGGDYSQGEGREGTGERRGSRASCAPQLVGWEADGKVREVGGGEWNEKKEWEDPTNEST